MARAAGDSSAQVHADRLWPSGAGKSMARAAGDSSAQVHADRLDSLLGAYLTRAPRRDLGHVLDEDTEPDWSALDRPAEAHWTLTVLFVGVDNGDKTDPDLQLTKEFNLIESAYKESALYHNANDRVHIKQIFFSKFAEVIKQIRREKPTVLHLGCHATKGKGLELFRQQVRSRDLVEAIQSWNATARRQQHHEIRLVILNACESDALARDLKSCVEFVIGHKHPVADDDAIDFSHLLYQCIFDGTALWDSFLQAKTACTGYRFFAQRDAREFQLVSWNFVLPLPDHRLVQDVQDRSAGKVSGRQSGQDKFSDQEINDSLCLFPARSEPGADPSTGIPAPSTPLSLPCEAYPVVSYLRKHGLARIAESLSENLGLEQIHQLRILYEHPAEIDKLDITLVQKVSLIKICQQVTADHMSLHNGTDSVSSPRSSLSENLSQASTPVQSPRGREVVGIHHEGDPQHLRAHVGYLFEHFTKYYREVEYDVQDQS
jgi:hypothetical protein